MATISHSIAGVPLDDSWDVIVLGGGPSGCGAALAAARGGARTLLVEANGFLGGMMTAGLVTVWAPFSDEGETTGNCYHGGLAYEIMTECKQGMPHVAKGAMNWVPADPERIKRIYDRRMADAGVTVLFDTMLCDVATEVAGGGRRVRYVLVANKAGLRAYSARVIIDATGDGDAAVLAGAACEKGAPGKPAELQPVSLCFVLGNIQEAALSQGPNLYAGNPQSPIFPILQSGRYPEIGDAHLCYTHLGPGIYSFNAGHIWDVDGTNPASVSPALAEGRRIADAFLRAFREFHPAAFAEAFLVATAPRLGVRETRRILGEYYLTIDDYFARRGFPDDVARNHYWIDVHTAKSERAASRETVKHVVERFPRFKAGESHGIPYRCLVPKGLTNLLVTGRAVSCDRNVLGALRTMPCAMNLGEAAGTAAAQLVAARGQDVREVDTGRLRADLQLHGAYLPTVA